MGCQNNNTINKCVINAASDLQLAAICKSLVAIRQFTT